MCFAGTDAGIGPCNEMSLCLRFCHRFLKHETFRAGGQSRPPLRIRCVFAALFRVYLKTPNAPGQRAFLRCAVSFFLEIRQYSCEKMSCATQKSLAAGHIMSFQTHPSLAMGGLGRAEPHVVHQQKCRTTERKTGHQHTENAKFHPKRDLKREIKAAAASCSRR